VEEGRVEGILLPKKRELTIPPAPFDEGGGNAIVLGEGRVEEG
jgi:hypothetical protein